MTDTDEIIYTETLDEALAVAFDDCPPGTIVTVHAETCDEGPDGDDCTCEPNEYVVGAQA